jgi:predicted acyltransferase
MDGSRERLASLDAFRGLAVAAMILVSTPGTWASVYPALDHALWNGWTPTDLVFPFLLFALGAAIPFALGNRRHRGRSPWLHVARRTVILAALGLVLNAIEAPLNVSAATFRIPGVLQRIAIVYAMTAVVVGTLSVRAQIGVTAGALVGYWLALRFVPVPGVGAGVLTPAGNLASFIDRAMFGRHMLYADFDPEGLLSTVPAVATALLGALAGAWIRAERGARATLWLFAAGAAAVAAGLAWGRVFPINKNLWTSSFALFSAGLAAQALAACQWLIGARPRHSASSPLIAFGRNALPAYFFSVGLDNVMTRVSLSGISMKAAAFRMGFASWLRPLEAASLGYAVAYVAAWAVVFVELYRRRIFIAI